jgi:uncharacterized phage protein (TIGR02216 family)
MRLGLGALRLPPGSFWALTPRELSAALGIGDGGPRPMSRAALAALEAQFPDESPAKGPHDDARRLR